MSKEYDHFWKFHNKDNMDVHAVKLIEQQAKRIKELEAENKTLKAPLGGPVLKGVRLWAK